MSDLIDRHETIKTITSYNGVVDKSVAKRLLLQMPPAPTELSNNSPKLDNKNGELISRQDAIRLAEQGQIQGFEWQFKKLCMLPSAEPRKKGKWIYGEKSCQDGWYCSECGGFIPWYYDFYGLDNIDFIEEFKTCPFCDSKMVSYTGADMREGEQDD